MTAKIEDYALIGDCETAALVDKNGSIDWLCWPDFSSEACFAALLGTQDNEYWKIAPVAGQWTTTRRYREGTPTLETTFEHKDGAIRLIDFMPIRGQNSDVVRSPTTFHRAVEIVSNAFFSQFADPHLVELAAARMAETRSTVFYGDFLACDQFDVSDQIQQIHQPVLVLCGAEDRLTPPHYSEFLAGQIPNARLEVIPQAGHMVMLEQPHAVATSLAKFLGNLSYHAGETV